MEPLQSFYVTLPSNVMGIRTNTIGNYVTYLPSHIKLDKKWKVAITEIFYINSWFNLKKENEVYLRWRLDEKNTWFKSEVAFVTVKLSPGRYESIEEIIKKIEEAENDPFYKTEAFTKFYKVKPKLYVDKPGHRLRMDRTPTTNYKFMYYEFTKEIAEMLGIDIYDKSNNSWDYKDKSVTCTAKHSYDLTGGLHSLYVYSDIADFSFVGDSRSQLLRVVEIPNNSKFGDHVHISFQKPYYMPVAKTDVASIEIDIKDDQGNSIDFKFGRVEVVLHFLKQ